MSYAAFIYKLKDAAGELYIATSGAYKAFSISNELYCNGTMSSFELLKRFTKPVSSKPASCAIPDDVIHAQERIQAGRKLAVMLKSKSVTEFPLCFGDLIEVFRHKSFEKGGKWSAPKPILWVDLGARSVTVPEKAGKEFSISIEDIRQAVPEESFAHTARAGIDQLDNMLCDIRAGSTEFSTEGQTKDFDASTDNTQDYDADFFSESPNIEQNGGDGEFVYWSEDNRYYPGVVQSLMTTDS